MGTKLGRHMSIIIHDAVADKDSDEHHLNSSETINLVLLGGPGSGKGTQSENLKTALGLCHVSSGELFRDNLKHDTPLGRSARAYIEHGQLVPDEITDAMVEERLSKITDEGFLLDGFPRTLPQAEALTGILKKLHHNLTAVIYIRVPDDELVERLGGRLICRNCDTPFHIQFRPPKRPWLCDKCGGRLYQRDDDKPETVRARLSTFHQQTEPLIAYYCRARVLVDLDGRGDPASVWKRLREFLRLLNA